MATSKRLGIVKFDPAVNSGQIMQIAIGLAIGFAAWGDVKSDIAVGKIQDEQVKREMTTQSQNLEKVSAEVRELRTVMNNIHTSVEVLRARAAPPVVAPVATR